MLKKLAFRIVVFLGLITLAGWGYTARLDRQMDATALEERLDSLPIPQSELVFLDEWARDGSWFIESREPEAVRMYLWVGSVDDGCRMLDDFYSVAEIAISPTSMTGNPEDWCGRRVEAPDGRVSIWVEPVARWTSLPAEYEDRSNVVTVRFAAYRR